MKLLINKRWIYWSIHVSPSVFCAPEKVAVVILKLNKHFSLLLAPPPPKNFFSLAAIVEELRDPLYELLIFVIPDFNRITFNIVLRRCFIRHYFCSSIFCDTRNASWDRVDGEGYIWTSLQIREKRGCICGPHSGAFKLGQPSACRCVAIGLQKWPSKDAAPELGHCSCLLHTPTGNVALC